jgi:hypothetical protein
VFSHLLFSYPTSLTFYIPAKMRAHFTESISN